MDTTQTTPADDSDFEDINVVNGTDASEALTGTNGFDDLFAGAGNDTLTGGEGSDFFFFDGNAGRNIVTDFNPEEDAIVIDQEGISFDDLTATQTADGLVVSWGDGNSVLLQGFTGELSEDFVFAGGFDDMDGDDAGDGVDDGMGDGTGDDTGDDMGNDLDINFVEGTDAAEALSGGAGLDDLYGGAGNDTLTGGAGEDFFIFGENSGQDVITDFNPAEDALFFENVSNFEDLTITQQNGGTLITNGTNSVFLQGVTDPITEAFVLVNNFTADDAAM